MSNTAPVVCDFLRNGGSVDRLRNDYGIIAKRHHEYQNLVLLKYNQIASPMGEPMVQECRGIILDEADNWRVVSRSFDKFFNHGEGHASEIDWSTAEVQEKVDGSLITVYAYRGAWHAATTGTPDGCGDVHGLDASGTWRPRDGVELAVPRTFSEYFWQVLFHCYSVPAFAQAPAYPCSEVSWLFELTGPLNRVVIPHGSARLTLLGARSPSTASWLPLSEASAMLGTGAPPAVRSFPLQSTEDILASFASMSPLAQEGYVVCDAAFRRIKVKHPGYVALHHAKDGLSTRAFVEIARSGETPEVISAFPELAPQLDEARARLGGLVAEVESDYERLRHIDAQKAFALEAVKTRCSSALFMLRSGKASSCRAFFAGMQIDQLMKLLGYKAQDTHMSAS